MLMDATRHSRNQKARLISPPVVSSQSMCLYFYYYMYGLTVNRLAVYSQRNGQRGPAIWAKQGNQGQAWQIAQVTLTTSGDPFNVSGLKTFTLVQFLLSFELKTNKMQK